MESRQQAPRAYTLPFLYFISVRDARPARVSLFRWPFDAVLEC